MPKIPDYDAVSNISSNGYVLGVQNDVVVRFPAETFKGETGNDGVAGTDGADGASYTSHIAVVNTGVYTTAYVTNYQVPSSFTELIDVSGAFSSGVYTCPATGTYKITLFVNYGNITSRCMLALFVNGANVQELFDVPNPQYMNISSSFCYNLNINDTVVIARNTTLGGSPDASQITFEMLM